MGVLIVSFAMIAVRAIGTRAHVTCNALDGLLVLVVCRSIDNWVCLASSQGHDLPRFDGVD